MAIQVHLSTCIQVTIFFPLGVQLGLIKKTTKKQQKTKNNNNNNKKNHRDTIGNQFLFSLKKGDIHWINTAMSLSQE